MTDAVAEALVTIGGVGFTPDAPVTFKSGILSPVYCDNRTFPFWPEEWAKVIRGFQALIEDRGVKVDVVGGIEAAGIPHSAALGFAAQLPSVFIRKEAKGHGRKKRVEGGDVSGRHVLLIEDLISTGMSSLSGVEALRAEGAIVTDCFAIISYNFAEALDQFAEAGVRLHTLTNFDAVLTAALQRGVVTDASAASVRDWMADPRGWPARQGHSA